jgi:LacI family transcriptional regulator
MKKPPRLTAPLPPRFNRNVLLTLGWYYPEIHRGVARYARDHHWHMTADFDDPIPAHWQGDGAITLLGAQPDLWHRLRRLKVPVVDLTESRPNIRLPRVTMDNVAIGRLAATSFLDQGYRHFAVVQRWELGVSRKRRDAFKLSLQAAGYTCDVLSWPSERGDKVDTRAQRHRWLMHRLEHLPKPLAVFAVRDMEAVETIEACLASGLMIPDQVAVLGVDNNELICECLQVPLSSIDPNLELVGYEGAAMLDRWMDGHPLSLEPTYIPPRGIVHRRSTDSLAVAHPAVMAALRHLHDHAEQPIQMKDLTRLVAMSRSGLEKAFREHYVRAPMEELRRVRLERAKKLLATTDAKIHTIARQTGFLTSHNLCRAFRQQCGTTPVGYRNAQHGNRSGDRADRPPRNR